MHIHQKIPYATQKSMMNRIIILCVAVCGLLVLSYGIFTYVSEEKDALHVQAKIVGVNGREIYSFGKYIHGIPTSPGLPLYDCDYAVRFRPHPETTDMTMELHIDRTQCLSVGDSVPIKYHPASDKILPIDDYPVSIMLISLGLIMVIFSGFLLRATIKEVIETAKT